MNLDELDPNPPKPPLPPPNCEVKIADYLYGDYGSLKIARGILYIVIFLQILYLIYLCFYNISKRKQKQSLFCKTMLCLLYLGTIVQVF